MQMFLQPQGAQLQGQGKELLELKVGVSIPAEGPAGSSTPWAKANGCLGSRPAMSNAPGPWGEHPTQAPTQAYYLVPGHGGASNATLLNFLVNVAVQIGVALLSVECDALVVTPSEHAHARTLHHDVFLGHDLRTIVPLGACRCSASHPASVVR